MGYNTDYSGEFLFENHSHNNKEKIEEMLGEDSRAHPEWGDTGCTYIDLTLNKDGTGIEWDGSEKSYEMCRKLNLIKKVAEKGEKTMNFTGKMVCQGENIEDRYIITYDKSKGAFIETKVDDDMVMKSLLEDRGYVFSQLVRMKDKDQVVVRATVLYVKGDCIDDARIKFIHAVRMFPTLIEAIGNPVYIDPDKYTVE